jgi:hypothetical protein
LHVPASDYTVSASEVVRYAIAGKEKAAIAGRPIINQLRCLMFVFDLTPVGHFALIHSQTETAFGVGANPSLEQNGGPFLSII